MPADNTPMGYVYINEAFGEGGVKNLDTKKELDVFYILFDTNLQDFDVMNRNHRYYDAGNIMDCIRSEKIQSLLKSNGWFGEFGHPMPEKAGEKLSPERIQDVPAKYRAFKILNPRLNHNILEARIQSAQGAVGEGFRNEVIAGWIPQFSVRVIAGMVSKNGKPYVHVRRLITYDAPWYPSHAIAHATDAPSVQAVHYDASNNQIRTTQLSSNQATSEPKTTLESASDIINGVMIPLKDILTDIGTTDVNTQLILESFGLDLSDMYGVAADRKHVIIKDENNYVYANINPQSVKRINEFYESF